MNKIGLKLILVTLILLPQPNYSFESNPVDEFLSKPLSKPTKEERKVYLSAINAQCDGDYCDFSRKVQNYLLVATNPENQNFNPDLLDEAVDNNIKEAALISYKVKNYNGNNDEGINELYLAAFYGSFEAQYALAEKLWNKPTSTLFPELAGNVEATTWARLIHKRSVKNLTLFQSYKKQLSKKNYKKTQGFVYALRKEIANNLSKRTKVRDTFSKSVIALMKKQDELRIAEEKRLAEQKRVARQKAADERKKADEKAANERKIAKRKAADERKKADEKAANERKIAKRKADEKRKVAEQKEKSIAAEKKLIEQRRIAEKNAEIELYNKKINDALGGEKSKIVILELEYTDTGFKGKETNKLIYLPQMAIKKAQYMNDKSRIETSTVSAKPKGEFESTNDYDARLLEAETIFLKENTATLKQLRKDYDNKKIQVLSKEELLTYRKFDADTKVYQFHIKFDTAIQIFNLKIDTKKAIDLNNNIDNYLFKIGVDDSNPNELVVTGALLIRDETLYVFDKPNLSFDTSNNLLEKRKSLAKIEREKSNKLEQQKINEENRIAAINKKKSDQAAKVRKENERQATIKRNKDKQIQKQRDLLGGYPLSNAAYSQVNAAVGCDSKYSDNKKEDIFNSKYKNHWLTWKGKIQLLESEGASINLDGFGTSDVRVKFADPSAGYNLNVDDFIKVRFLMKRAGGCFLPFFGEKAVVL